MQDELNERLFNSVHRGLALSSAPFPEGGVEVQIYELRISPPIVSWERGTSAEQLPGRIETLTAWTVAGLFDVMLS